MNKNKTIYANPILKFGVEASKIKLAPLTSKPISPQKGNICSFIY